VARPRKQFATKAERLKHEESLRLRRARQHESRTLEIAKKAADGQADFAVLVEAETQRVAESHQQRIAVKGGSTSPKTITAARDNLSTAFDLMGGVPALVVWGRQNPTEFYRIWARLIPKEVAETTQTLPLETLLAKLSERAELSVAEAALEIGQETLDAARETVMIEDATGLRPEDIN
jgi:hypothetical protein